MGIIPSQMKVIEDLLEPGMRVLTIGRLTLHPNYLPHHRANPEAQYFDEFAATHFPEVVVEPLDGSDYQGAQIIQDMNLPLDSANLHLAGRYDLIVDGGSLEHFFDVPQALRNYAALLKIGGKLYITTNANNHFGHGFYQFSADFFYRVFSEDNGFRTVDCFLEVHPLVAAEISARREFFDAIDPMRVGRRPQFINDRPVLIHCLAEKISAKEMKRTIIQSDYQEKWRNSNAETKRNSKLKKLLKQVFDSVPIFWRLYDWWKMRIALNLNRNADFQRRR